MWHFVLKLPLREGRVDFVFSQAASRVLGRCFLAAEQECWSPPPRTPTVCFVTHVVSVLKREDADACRVHPAQRLFPPDAPVLADVRRRLDPAEPHLPHLHHVRSHVSGASSTSLDVTDLILVSSRRDSDDAVEPIGSLPGQAR